MPAPTSVAGAPPRLRVADEQAVQRRAVERRAHLREQCGGARPLSRRQRSFRSPFRRAASRPLLRPVRRWRVRRPAQRHSASRPRRRPGRATRSPRRSRDRDSPRCGASRLRSRRRSPRAAQPATRRRRRSARQRPAQPALRRRAASRAGATRRRARRQPRPRAPPRARYACGSAPTGTTTARPATRLKPFASKKSTDDVPASPRVDRGVATRSVCEREGATGPSNGRKRSRITSRPRRNTTRTRGCTLSESVAPTASAPGAPAGPDDRTKVGPAMPSLPAGVTTSVFRSSAPCTAIASGPRRTRRTAR